MDGYYYGRGRKMGCHAHASPLDMIPGIAQSCNAYFANVYRRIIEKYPTPQEGVDTWADHLKSFGLGDYLGSDLSTGRPGKIPTSEYYNNIYDYPTYKWFSTATISNAIGQGEVLDDSYSTGKHDGCYCKPGLVLYSSYLEGN